LLLVLALPIFSFGFARYSAGAHAQTSTRNTFPAGLSDFQQRSLLIMDEKVVNDPDRTTDPCSKVPMGLKMWSFGALMQGIAADDETAAVELMRRWLAQFRTDQDINDEHVSPRDIDSIWKPWEQTGWDIRRVPFRLLAIVNRIDLLRSPLLAGENAGELRFVFGAVDISDKDRCVPLPFAVILEYGVRKSSCSDLQAWAHRWIDLAALDPSQPDYRVSLSQITSSISNANSSQAKPNGSAIDHIRTNEALARSDWQLREFKLDPGTKGLMQDTVMLTPREDLNGKQSLTAFLSSIDQELKSQDYWIPRRFPTLLREPLLGAVATAGTRWKHASDFAKNTCSGCHGAESGTERTHINPITKELSAFLETKEMPSREMALKDLAQNGCSASLQGAERRLVH
jgi:hypothetical protein